MKLYDSALYRLKESLAQENELQFRENTFEISRLNAKYEAAKKEKQILEEQQKVRTNRNWLIVATPSFALRYRYCHPTPQKHNQKTAISGARSYDQTTKSRKPAQRTRTGQY